MSESRRGPGFGLRAWIALLLFAGLAHVPGAFAQVYKCTGTDGRTTFSDKPCANQPGTTPGNPGVKQEVMRPVRPAGATAADAISALCARHEGSKPSDGLIQSLPEKQRESVTGALRGLATGLSRDRASQGTLSRVTLHLDAARNAIICTPVPAAQSPGAPAATRYVAHRIEPNGRMEILQPGEKPLVYNDANEPTTVAARCSSLITACVRSKLPASAGSIDECFEQQPVCPAGRVDPALSCCPQACKDAFRRERTRQSDPVAAMMKVIFGDESGSPSCIAGMPGKG